MTVPQSRIADVYASSSSRSHENYRKCFQDFLQQNKRIYLTSFWLSNSINCFRLSTYILSHKIYPTNVIIYPNIASTKAPVITLNEDSCYDHTYSARLVLLACLPGPDRVDAWMEVVRQVNRVSRRGADVGTDLVSSIKADKSWALYRCAPEEVDDLVLPSQVHVTAAEDIRDRQRETLNDITCEWGLS